jgi:DNA polymerase III alpha subunit
VIRPGVASMMRDYIYRFHNPYGFDYLHPVFAEQLRETYGVMIYQEDVMKILHHFAGLDLGEADLIRRWLSGKKRSSDAFRALQQKYFANCRARGYAPALIDAVWQQIESFGAYSFCKAHSASFAVESFQSLFLKAYYPREFMVAVINNFGGFYATEFYVHELRQAGATVHAPCVNHSEYRTIISGRDVYLGFAHLKSLEQRSAEAIVAQRRVHGPFKGIEDFIRRVDLPPAQITLLIHIGALRFTGRSKCTLLWEKNRVLGEGRKGLHTATLLEPPAFAEATAGEGEDALPELEDQPYDQAFDELELLGFPLCSPFELLDQTPPADATVARQLPQYLGRPVELFGYLVCTKDVHTKHNEWMKFATWLDRDGQFFDTVHFPDVLRTNPFQGRGVYCVQGFVTVEFGFYTIQVARIDRLAYRADDRYAGL